MLWALVYVYQGVSLFTGVRNGLVAQNDWFIIPFQLNYYIKMIIN